MLDLRKKNFFWSFFWKKDEKSRKIKCKTDLRKMVRIMEELPKIRKTKNIPSHMRSHPKKEQKVKTTFNELWSFLFLCAYLVRQSNIIVRYYANRIDYFLIFFPFSNVYISSRTKISVNSWKFCFFFILSIHIQSVLIACEFCWICNIIVPAGFSFLQTKTVCLFFSSFFTKCW